MIDNWKEAAINIAVGILVAFLVYLLLVSLTPIIFPEIEQEEDFANVDINGSIILQWEGSNDTLLITIDNK